MQFDATYKGPLDDAKAEAKATIDRKAGEVRLRYITDAPGQEATYDAKSREVDRWDQLPLPKDQSHYPLIHAAQRANGMDTAEDARNLIAMRRDLWSVKGAEIEEYREGGKRVVDAAATVRAAFEARDVAVGELDGV